MPIFYACESEEQAKELCAKNGGQYTGRFALNFTWQAYTGTCIASYTRANATGFDRLMVVYDQHSETYEHIVIAGEATAHNHFVVGGREDAPDDLRSRYFNYLRERKEARSKAKSMHLTKEKSCDNTRLRKIKGKTVVVIAGTTIKHGTTGRVAWVGFGENGAPRVGFDDEEGKRRWTELGNVCEFKPLPLLEQAS
jgi:hypothetical protein